MMNNKHKIGDEVKYSGQTAEVTAVSNYHPKHGNHQGNWFYSLKHTDAQGVTWWTDSITPVCESELESI
jgi:hypothetical protein